MKIVGCDLHTRYQQVAMLDNETGELVAPVRAQKRRGLGLSEAVRRLGTAYKPMLRVTSAEFDGVAAINQRTPYFLAQEFLSHIASYQGNSP